MGRDWVPYREFASHDGATWLNGPAVSQNAGETAYIAKFLYPMYCAIPPVKEWYVITF
jgi:hypothetical protein